MNVDFEQKIALLQQQHEALLQRSNLPVEETNGIVCRYTYPIVTREHIPLEWRYDFNPATNPYCMERIGFNATMNSGAIKWNGKYVLVVRVEGADRKSFFAVAESPNGIDNFRFWKRPITLPDINPAETNVYDMRLTAHEDGWIYGIFCSECHDDSAPAGDLSSAVAKAGIVRTKDLVEWERLPDLKSYSQQRNVVLHPEFVNGKYALYTRPQDDFINAGNGGGIGWALIDDITQAEVKEEKKPATKKAPAAKTVATKAEPAKTEVKAEEKKPAAKKPAAKKPAAVKTTETVFIEYNNGQINVSDIVAKAKEALGNKAVKELNVYYQPETGMVYYTADGESGSYSL